MPIFRCVKTTVYARVNNTREPIRNALPTCRARAPSSHPRTYVPTYVRTYGDRMVASAFVRQRWTLANDVGGIQIARAAAGYGQNSPVPRRGRVQCSCSVRPVRPVRAGRLEPRSHHGPAESFNLGKRHLRVCVRRNPTKMLGNVHNIIVRKPRD